MGPTASAVLIAGAVITTVGCRDFHEPIPYDECQPYELACPGCLFEEDTSPTGLHRVWSCEEPDLGVLDVVKRRATTMPADDTRYYDGGNGERVAASRIFDAPRDVCGREQREAWYGSIIETCEPLCEHEPDLPEADPTLPDCGGIQ